MRTNIMHEHHWMNNHPWFIALFLTVLIMNLIISLLSFIQVGITTGVWALFG